MTATFATPINVSAGVTYVASYFAPTGKISYDAGFFTSNLTIGPITMPSTSASGGNGVYVYTSDVFPTDTYNANNYWIDPIYTPTGTGLTPPARYNMLAVEIRGAATNNGIYTYTPDGVALTPTPPPTFQGTPTLGWLGQHGRITEPATNTGPDIIQMGARPYIPTLGRFLATDPIEAGNTNDYNYPTDPINGRDLDGRRVQGTCGSTSVFVIFGVSITSCEVHDDEGNSGTLTSYGFGWGVDVSASAGYLYSEAKNVHDLTGRSSCTSGGVLVVAGSVCIWPAKNGDMASAVIGGVGIGRKPGATGGSS